MSALVTDHDRLTMMQICLEQGLTQPAVFELVVRTLPPRRNFLVAAGLEQALQFLKSLSFSEAEFTWLRDQGGFSAQMLDYARTMRFEGDVDAMPEGTVFFADEPILRVTAPLPMAQLVESRLLNLVHFETVIASSAARLVLAARGRPLLDLGLRRSHGGEAALLAARAAYLAGFEGTATADAARRFGIPVFSTLSVGSGDFNPGTLISLARARADRSTLLADHGDASTRLVELVESAVAMHRAGFKLAGVQIEGCDLPARAAALRALLDAAGLSDLSICASGDLDEADVEALISDKAPIDQLGLRGWLPNEGSATRVDALYAMRHYPMSDAPEAAAWSGARNVLRRLGADGRIEADLIGPETESGEREGLLQPCMRAGKRVGRPLTLDQSRAYHATQIAQLPDALRTLGPATVPMRVRTMADETASAGRLDAGQRSR
jgi:nicotinate phosphoribosyltransferase